VGKNTWTALTSVSVSVNTNGVVVQAVQHLLAEYNLTSTTDGIFTESLKSIIANFQLSHNFPPTGVIDSATFKSLITDCNGDGTALPQASPATSLAPTWRSSLPFFVSLLFIVIVVL